MRKRAEFGNPILRQTAESLEISKISTKRIQNLIADMRETLQTEKLGVGLAAPQVGEGVALVVVCVRPLPHRKAVEPFDAVLINPEITETYGRRIQLWEGCISGGPGKASLFAKVPRYKKVRVKYYDEAGKNHHKTFEGFLAHIVQHEVDHLNGLLFVDRVKDTKSYVTYAEYMKRVGRQKN
jgi:peptide deformylase